MTRRGRRPAGSGDTKRAIEAAARELFASHGYQRTTMRAVASRAGVDAALIHHYFGTKRGLLAAVLAPPLDPLQVLRGVERPRERMGYEVVRRVLTVWDSQPVARDQMLATVRTAMADDHSPQVLRDSFIGSIHDALLNLVNDDQRQLRASLVMSQMSGLALARYVIKVPAVVDASPTSLAEQVGPVLQHYLTGTLPRTPRTAVPTVGRPAAPAG